MPSRAHSELLLVGSLPADTTESAFSKGAEFFGDLVFALPDGETGPRRAWVGYEREQLCRPHPDLMVVEETESQNGIPRHAYETPIFKIRDGVKSLHWKTWPRIDVAIESYEIFRRLQDKGTIPPGLRMQVSLPFPSSALNGFKSNFAADYAIAGPAYEELAGRELERLMRTIPPSALAIQWDVCYEVLDIEGVIAWMGNGAWERFTGPVSRLGPVVPEEVLLGYHLCYGTFPDWPMYEARDMSLLVGMANFAIMNSGRTVDWLHLAGPKYLRSEDDRFFSPLSDLRPDVARIFLGIVLPLDGAAGLKRRHATASKYLKDFGVSLLLRFRPATRRRWHGNHARTQPGREIYRALASPRGIHASH
jgi:hypothetical protein